MSVVFSGNLSGRFTSTGVAKFIELPTGWDTIRIVNETASAAAAAAGSDRVVEAYFQKGMTNGRGFAWSKTTVTSALQLNQIAAGLGFFTQDTSVTTPGVAVAITAISNAAIPVCSGVSTTLTANSSIVRLYNPTGALQLGGIDFTVGTLGGGTFQLAHMAAIVAAAATTNGTFRIVPFNPYYYPSTRVITGISSAAQAVVTMSVTHSYIVGQKVRINVSPAFGMTQINGLEATIVATGAVGVNGTTTNTITIDIDTTGFTAFAFPLTAAAAFTPAMVVPMGENMAQALLSGTNVLGDSVYNNAQTGILLMPAATGPAGVNADVISWTVTKSFNT